jgi:hypothetical protein
VQRSNAKHYKSDQTVTEIKLYDGYAHLLPAQPGWEAIADFALDWALGQISGNPIGADTVTGDLEGESIVDCNEPDDGK